MQITDFRFICRSAASQFLYDYISSFHHILQIFPGNAGKTDTVKNSLKEFVSAQFIRIQPTGYHGYKVLRVEVYGILLTKGIYETKVDPQEVITKGLISIY